MSPACRRSLVSAGVLALGRTGVCSRRAVSVGNPYSVIFIFSKSALLFLKPLLLSAQPPVWVTALVFDDVFETDPALPDQKTLFEGWAVPPVAARCLSAWSSALAH